MKLKTGFIFLFSLLIIFITVTSCNKEEEMPDPDDGDDEYSGSIAPEDTDTPPDDSSDEEQIDEGDPNAIYEIATADDLKNKLKLKGTYILTADIDLGGAEWKPIGTAAHPFSGIFDGSGHKISNFKITEKPEESTGDVSPAFTYSYGGFFGVTDGATVKNIKFEGININILTSSSNTFMYAGTVAGYAKNTVFENVTVTSANLSSQSKEYITYVGGLAGSMRKSKATACTINATLTAKESFANAICGGISGETSESELTKCSSSGSVSSTAKYGLSYSGGLVGYCSSSKISKCVSASTVDASVSSYSAQTGKKGSASAGGFAAIIIASSANKRTEISDSYTAVTCTVSAKGNKNAAYAGGFAAFSEYGIYTNCYSRSDVNAESNSDAVYAAGLISYIINHDDVADAKPYPYDTKISGCFSIGNVNIKTKTMAYYLGSLVYSDSSSKESFIEKSGYNENMNFYINSESPDNTNEKINFNGFEANLGVYGDINVLSTNYGWSKDVWEITNEYPSLKG